MVAWTLCYTSKQTVRKKTLENTEGAIKNCQSIENLQHKSTRDEETQNKNITQYVLDTLYTNKHK